MQHGGEAQDDRGGEHAAIMALSRFGCDDR
jgi:hypothetical protein